MSKMPHYTLPRIDLLRRLAEHLETGQLGHERFYFGFFNYGYSSPKRQHYLDQPRLKLCNSAGCGIGECPFIFPEWYFDYAEQPVYGMHTSSEMSARGFFSLDTMEYQHLFVPDRQLPLRFGGERLTKEATKEQVAGNIWIFCEHIDKKHGHVGI